MIDKLVIDGFKRFERQAFEMRKLTVLAGRNGAGKTSLIHSLLLVHDATRRADGISQLNGPFGLELGWFEDLININRFGKDPQFLIELSANGVTAEWVFGKGDTDLYASVKLPDRTPNAIPWDQPRGLQYICAERSGPRLTQRSSPLPTDRLEVGPTGAHVAQVIERLVSFSVDPLRIAGQTDRGPALLKSQIEYWLSDIVRPTQLDTTELPGTDIVALRFKTPEGDWVRPTNMGFGVSYALPVIVAALTAPANGVLIIENPEAHLHPAGQSEMGRFLAQMASSGVQVVVETHSDHILNGIRLAVAGESSLRAGEAIVHYFPDGEAEACPMEFTASGGFREWPDGFFDQFRIDVARLSKAARSRP